MRETIASTWVYQLVIIFILMFVAFLLLSLTYSKNFKTKNEMISIIEKYEGVNENSIQIINNYLSYNNYRVKGSCKANEGWMGSTDLNTTRLEDVTGDTKYYYCLRKRYAKNDTDSKSNNKRMNVKSMMYYQIKIFFKFNLPIVGDIHTFSIDGTTNDIFDGSDLFDAAKNTYRVKE